MQEITRIIVLDIENHYEKLIFLSYSNRSQVLEYNDKFEDKTETLPIIKDHCTIFAIILNGNILQVTSNSLIMFSFEGSFI